MLDNTHRMECLQLDNDLFKTDKICPITDMKLSALVMNGQFNLATKGDTAVIQLNSECLLIYSFQKAWP